MIQLACSSQILYYIENYKHKLKSYDRNYNVYYENKLVGYANDTLKQVFIMNSKVWVKEQYIKFTYQYRGNDIRTVESKYKLITDDKFNLKSFKEENKSSDKIGIINDISKKFGVLEGRIIIIDNNEEVQKIEVTPPVYGVTLTEFLITSILNDDDPCVLYKYFSVSSFQIEEETICYLGIKVIKIFSMPIKVKVYKIENTLQDITEYYYYDMNGRLIKYTMYDKMITLYLDNYYDTKK